MWGEIESKIEKQSSNISVWEDFFTHRSVGVVVYHLCSMWKVNGSMPGESHFEDVWIGLKMFENA